MSLFESLGERTERLKQRLTGDGAYACRACDHRLGENRETCPHCGAEEVVSVK